MNAHAPSPVRVAILIATHRRPAGLARLLRSLDAQVLPAEVSLRGIVADDDVVPRAAPLCAALERTLSLPITCVRAPRRGIPFARNAAVEAALGTADLFAFVDDDMELDPGWLASRLRAIERYAADVVSAPVRPRFLAGTPPWLVPSYEPLRHPSGTLRDRAFTHDVLLRADLLADPRLRFDARLAHSGGSDTHLFRRLHAAGARIVWVDEPLAWERISPERTSPEWVLRRAFRFGTTAAFIARDLEPPFRAFIGVFAPAAYRLLKGSVTLLPATLAQGRRGLLRALRHLAYASGMILGLLGLRYDEYRR